MNTTNSNRAVACIRFVRPSQLPAVETDDCNKRRAASRRSAAVSRFVDLWYRRRKRYPSAGKVAEWLRKELDIIRRYSPPSKPNCREQRFVQPGEGYRLLAPAEIIREGDEYWCWPPPQNGWGSPSRLMWGQRKPDAMPYRRRLNAERSGPAAQDSAT